MIINTYSTFDSDSCIGIGCNDRHSLTNKLRVKHKKSTKTTSSTYFWARTSTATKKLACQYTKAYWDGYGTNFVMITQRKGNLLKINFIIGVSISKSGCFSQIFQVSSTNLKNNGMLVWRECQKAVLSITRVNTSIHSS